MASPRTVKSDSPLDTPRNRKLLAAIKRELRRVQRRVDVERQKSANGIRPHGEASGRSPQSS